MMLSEDKSLLDEVVRQSLRRELHSRRSMRPHAQLGVRLDADAETARLAFERLRAQYYPENYTRHGEEARQLAAEIGELLQHAIDCWRRAERAVMPLLPRKRDDETLRAIETLHRSIERRFAEGCAHRDAGRLGEAIRSFESVLALERNHGPAFEELHALRKLLEPPRSRHWWRRLFRSPEH
jgi:hypothetical protein